MNKGCGMSAIRSLIPLVWQVALTRTGILEGIRLGRLIHQLRHPHFCADKAFKRSISAKQLLHVA
jgi:hypothetical protein